jgi:hypothetical protein
VRKDSNIELSFPDIDSVCNDRANAVPGRIDRLRPSHTLRYRALADRLSAPEDPKLMPIFIATDFDCSSRYVSPWQALSCRRTSAPERVRAGLSSFRTVRYPCSEVAAREVSCKRLMVVAGSCEVAVSRSQGQVSVDAFRGVGLLVGRQPQKLERLGQA